MKSLLLQRIISNTLLTLVTLDSFVLDAEWVLHKFQMQFVSSKSPNSIDDVFGTIANGKLCVLVLVNISLQVFLNDSQHISDDFGHRW
jgi:hypothetical protein